MSPNVSFWQCQLSLFQGTLARNAVSIDTGCTQCCVLLPQTCSWTWIGKVFWIIFQKMQSFCLKWFFLFFHCFQRCTLYFFWSFTACTWSFCMFCPLDIQSKGRNRESTNVSCFSLSLAISPAGWLCLFVLWGCTFDGFLTWLHGQQSVANTWLLECNKSKKYPASWVVVFQSETV